MWQFVLVPFVSIVLANVKWDNLICISLLLFYMALMLSEKLFRCQYLSQLNEIYLIDSNIFRQLCCVSPPIPTIRCPTQSSYRYYLQKTIFYCILSISFAFGIFSHKWSEKISIFAIEHRYFKFECIDGNIYFNSSLEIILDAYTWVLYTLKPNKVLN